jgi:hypothetical protein
MNKYTIVNRRDIEPGFYWFRFDPTDQWQPVELTKSIYTTYVTILDQENNFALSELTQYYPEFEFIGPLEPPA